MVKTDPPVEDKDKVVIVAPAKEEEPEVTIVTPAKKRVIKFVK
jgi:hypothetical protein